MQALCHSYQYRQRQCGGFTINKVNKIYLIGDMVLSQKDKHLSQVYNIDGHKYSLINDSTLLDEESLKDIQQEL